MNILPNVSVTLMIPWYYLAVQHVPTSPSRIIAAFARGENVI